MGLDWLGAWQEDLDGLRDSFTGATPFEHVVIPGFFREDFAELLWREFPDPTVPGLDWKHYDNPIEQKYSLNSFSGLSGMSSVFEVFQNEAFVKLLQGVTGIGELEADPTLHGAGLHAYPRHGKLDVHLDYSIHPFLKKERRVNLIVYLNRDWRPEYGGDLQLWDARVEGCTQVVVPGWNTAVLFRTSDISYHGIPRPIQCPEGEFRKSLAVYYVSEPREGCSRRYKAEFVPLPGQPVSEGLQRLYNIRKERVLTSADLWPTWREDGQGYW